MLNEDLLQLNHLQSYDVEINKRNLKFFQIRAQNDCKIVTIVSYSELVVEVESSGAIIVEIEQNQ